MQADPDISDNKRALLLAKEDWEWAKIGKWLEHRQLVRMIATQDDAKHLLRNYLLRVNQKKEKTSGPIEQFYLACRQDIHKEIAVLGF